MQIAPHHQETSLSNCQPAGIDLELERQWLDKLVPGYTGDHELHRIGGDAVAIRSDWWQPSFDFLEHYCTTGSTCIDDVLRLPSFDLQRRKQRKNVSSSPGIYFAFQGRDLVYVGVAAMISSRVTASHHKLKIALKESGVLKIHYFVVTHSNYRNLPVIEQALIRLFAPKFNTHHAGHKSKRGPKATPTILDRETSTAKSNLSIPLDDPFMESLVRHAEERGITPERLAQKLLRQAINMLEN